MKSDAPQQTSIKAATKAAVAEPTRRRSARLSDAPASIAEQTTPTTTAPTTEHRPELTMEHPPEPTTAPPPLPAPRAQAAQPAHPTVSPESSGAVSTANVHEGSPPPMTTNARNSSHPPAHSQTYAQAATRNRAPDTIAPAQREPAGQLFTPASGQELVALSNPMPHTMDVDASGGTTTPATHTATPQPATGVRKRCPN
ncbi:hypothetical protein GLOTRDRAFT_133056 [Gloeophyllum trabeum ATCC 11539]|uniref:Uncharacterized protein n=1 Tax=Gloeophyllum trabeum (strain ATCC 11539 / FP-39264 / Madison 617) TaxID=670483 RepID=S7PVZ5_GLOTA|nr:uncharacterized protein GLOTRDRAFT_133056 [Gloeophyllum trabeum ATCC 11539]EPQ51688.1 hypothetical protein GLOTRDRAFT_133056 [Gloeophyllum trabeum ATCC 11539]